MGRFYPLIGKLLPIEWVTPTHIINIQLNNCIYIKRASFEVQPFYIYLDREIRWRIIGGFKAG